MSDFLDESIVKDNQNTDDFRTYFGKEAEYYLRQLKRKNEGQNPSFNIWPFLFGLLWMVYKKLYIHAAIFLAIQFVLSMLQEWAMEVYHLQKYAPYLEIFWMLLFGLVLGFYGNEFYIQKAQKDINQIKNLGVSEEEKNQMLLAKGGSNMGAVIIVILILVIISLLSR